MTKRLPFVKPDPVYSISPESKAFEFCCWDTTKRSTNPSCKTFVSKQLRYINRKSLNRTIEIVTIASSPSLSDSLHINIIKQFMNQLCRYVIQSSEFDSLCMFPYYYIKSLEPVGSVQLLFWDRLNGLADMSISNRVETELEQKHLLKPLHVQNAMLEATSKNNVRNFNFASQAYVNHRNPAKSTVG